jgi:cbb3-type cytochrome oxidase subunit 3
MTPRQTSYWLLVLIGGPIAGVFAGAFWTIFMSIVEGPTLVRWIIPGAMFGFFMGILFTAMIAFLLWPTRRECLISEAATAKERVISEAQRLRYALATENGNYLWFRPRSRFRIKPFCSTIEVWLLPEAVIIDGPVSVVPTIIKRLIKSAKMQN